MNKKGMEKIENEYGLVQFLLYLENSCGGQGNGLALMKNGKVTWLKKGVKYSCDAIARKMLRSDFDWAVFHTRIKSVGVVADRNCHPFRSGKTILAMNGTETGFSKIADFLDTTDTEAVLQVTKKMHLPLIKTLEELKSVFMGFENGVPFVTTGSSFSDLEIAFDKTTNALIFASEFPSKIQSYIPTKFPFAWSASNPKLTGLKAVDWNSKFKRYYGYGYYGNSYANEKKETTAESIVGKTIYINATREEIENM
jgi:hypothetical protein